MDRLPQFDDQPSSEPTVQQRLGERYQITLPIEWSPPREGRFKPKPKIEMATTTDWSLTGLGFVAPTRDDLRAPCPINVTVGPVTGQALIVAIRPADEPGMSRFGVEFRDPVLEGVARNLIGIHLDRKPDDRRKRKPQVDILGQLSPQYEEWN